MTDPISDMLTRIRNASIARHSTVEVPHSKLKEAIAAILTQEGYLNSFKVQSRSPRNVISITLKYQGKSPAIDSLDRISKPGRRIYVKAGKSPRILGGYGISIISTSKGLITNKEAAKQKLGGEIICRVW